MEHITNVLVYSNRCEVLDSHVFTVGDRGFPHIRLKFIYMFGAETLQGKQLELKYILPDKSYQVENINVTEKDEVLFPIHYSVFVNGGWTTLKITIVEGANRITLDDIIIKTKKLEAEQEFQHKDVKAIVQTEITKISKKIKEFEEETKTELNTLKSNLSQNLETEKNSNIEALKEAYNNEIKKLDGDVKKVVTKYLKENTDTFNGEIAKLTNKDGVYTLKVAKAASGALYTNSKGLSIHSSGKDAIYTVGGKDISCDIVKAGTATKPSTTPAKPVTKVVEYNLKGKIKVEFIGQNTAKVTDFSGKTYTLKRAKAASGEYFENENGVSLHVKADEGVFTVKGVDYSFGK